MSVQVVSGGKYITTKVPFWGREKMEPLVFFGEKDPAYVITWNDTENIYESLTIS